MRKTFFVPVLMLFGLFACNDGGSKSEKVSEADQPATAHSAHATVDSSQLNTELPAIPDGARVFFVNLKDGQTVKSPFKVQMGIENIALDTAGIIRPASGHHHILIDAGDSLASGIVVPKDSLHLHFGNAQSEAELKLAPGVHQVTLQYADGIHRSYGSKLAATLRVTVQ